MFDNPHTLLSLGHEIILTLLHSLRSQHGFLPQSQHLIFCRSDLLSQTIGLVFVMIKFISKCLTNLLECLVVLFQIVQDFIVFGLSVGLVVNFLELVELLTQFVVFGDKLGVLVSDHLVFRSYGCNLSLQFLDS